MFAFRLELRVFKIFFFPKKVFGKKGPLQDPTYKKGKKISKASILKTFCRCKRFF